MMSNNENFDLICQNVSFKRTAIACEFQEQVHETLKHFLELSVNLENTPNLLNFLYGDIFELV